MFVNIVPNISVNSDAQERAGYFQRWTPWTRLSDPPGSEKLEASWQS